MPGRRVMVLATRRHSSCAESAKFGSTPAPGVKTFRCGKRCDSPWKKASPRAELPSASSGSETVAKPPTPGATTSSPPATPDLAGIPTESAHRPDPSYRPAIVIVARTYRTSRADSTRSPVCGFTPPLARVAAAVASMVGVSRRLFTCKKQ
ncbi:hypothetical protein T492DRAFT_1141848 [Pavlovales sp. CCMP2436]|nr:hypothetical protein T492DRAFT_1141848 [Pavlovales sp. CCMP2436]